MKTTRFYPALATACLSVVLVGLANGQQDAAGSPPVTLFKDVQVFSGTEAELLEVDVLVVGNLIKKIGKDLPSTGTYELDRKTEAYREIEVGAPLGYREGYTVRIPVEGGGTKTEKVPVKVIDGGGRTLMPGLMDMHVHMSLYRPVSAMRDTMDLPEVAGLGAARCENLLLSGITTVRDTGGMAAFLRRLIDDKKALKGPRIITAEAVITPTSGHGDFRERADRNPKQFQMGPSHWMEEHFSHICDGPTEVRRASRENFRRGADFLKLMSTGGVSSQFDPLHSVGLTKEEVEAAVEIAEGWESYVTVHGIAPRGTMIAIEAGVHCVEHGAGLSEDIMKKMAEKGIWLCPSVAALLGMSPEEGRKLLDPASYEKFMVVRGGISETMRLAVKHGVKMAYGTDIVPPMGDALNSDRRTLLEFEFLSEFMPNWRVLRMATGNAGELAALSGPNLRYRDGGLGQVKEGFYADLLLIDGDPTKDIKLLTEPENLKLIMKDGVIYKNTLSK